MDCSSLTQLSRSGAAMPAMPALPALPALLLLLALLPAQRVGAAPAEPASRPSPTPCGTSRLPTLVPLAEHLWLVPAATGDGDSANRGQVSNLLVAVEPLPPTATPPGAAPPVRLWLVGSGPSPAFGQALACALHARWPGARRDVASPWPHPEAVLGVQGLGARSHAAHADVARQMAQRCATCLDRLRARLGAAAADLGDGDPVALPDTLLTGDQGAWGPWRWWRLQRAEDTTVTVWWHAPSGIAFAPGLLGDGRAPDGRDADIVLLARSTTLLARRSLPPAWPASTRWVGEQGPLQAPTAPAAAAAYWRALLQAVDEGLDRGDSGEAPPARLPDLPGEVASGLPGPLPGALPAHPMADFTASPLHALNWQRAWRQAESRWLQRSLR
jgi:hypothetical protein